MWIVSIATGVATAAGCSPGSVEKEGIIRNGKDLLEHFYQAIVLRISPTSQRISDFLVGGEPELHFSCVIQGDNVYIISDYSV
jgi:hypothetical protein